MITSKTEMCFTGQNTRQAHFTIYIHVVFEFNSLVQIYVNYKDIYESIAVFSCSLKYLDIMTAFMIMIVINF